MAYDLVIKGGFVVDGTGAARYRADVAIGDGRIVEIGKSIAGAARQSIERRRRWCLGLGLRLRLLLGLAGRQSGLHPLGAQLREIAQRLLEGRPVLGLVRRELQAGLQRGDARVGEGGPVLGAEQTPLLGTRAARGTLISGTLLCIDERRTSDGKHGRRGHNRLEHVIPPQDEFAFMRKIMDRRGANSS